MEDSLFSVGGADARDLVGFRWRVQWRPKRTDVSRSKTKQRLSSDSWVCYAAVAVFLDTCSFSAATDVRNGSLFLLVCRKIAAAGSKTGLGLREWACGLQDFRDLPLRRQEHLRLKRAEDSSGRQRVKCSLFFPVALNDTFLLKARKEVSVWGRRLLRG